MALEMFFSGPCSLVLGFSTASQVVCKPIMLFVTGSTTILSEVFL